MNINMIAGALVWLFLGVPLAGLALWILTAPFRAVRNARRNRQPSERQWRDQW